MTFLLESAGPVDEAVVQRRKLPAFRPGWNHHRWQQLYTLRPHIRRAVGFNFEVKSNDG